jgi:7-cyano-7-deazaguanine reductase
MNRRPVKYGSRKIKKAKLELWDNPSPERDYEIEINFPEFTCLCPRSGYPDFASINVHYVPDKKIVELKSFKLYLNSYRDMFISHEEAANRIFDALNEALKPRSMEVMADFNPRGNMKTLVRVLSRAREQLL